MRVEPKLNVRAVNEWYRLTLKVIITPFAEVFKWHLDCHFADRLKNPIGACVLDSLFSCKYMKSVELFELFEHA